jgi:hypothetical protein
MNDRPQMNKDESLLIEACRLGLLHIVQLMMSNRQYSRLALRMATGGAARHGYLEVVKYMDSVGVHAAGFNEFAIESLKRRVYHEIVEYIKSAQRGIK